MKMQKKRPPLALSRLVVYTYEYPFPKESEVQEISVHNQRVLGQCGQLFCEESTSNIDWTMCMILNSFFTLATRS